jgi:predicted RND superfamily exporter protein
MAMFTHLVIRFRLLILAAVVTVTALLGYRLRDLQQDENLLDFLPAEDPDIVLFRRVSAEFGGLDVAVVGVESPRLLTADGIEAVRRMTRAARAVPGVYHTLSFTELPHLTSTEAEFSIVPIVPEQVPHDREGIERIRDVALNDPLVAGRLLSEDGRAALILCFLASADGQQGMARGIREAVTAEAGRMRLYFGGLPFIQSHIGGGTRRDIAQLTPYVLLLAAFTTFLFFRRFFGALLVMTTVGIAAVWTIGGMAAMGAKMTVISTSLPMVLVAIGGAFGGHVLAAYYVANAQTAVERVELAVRDIFGPVVMSMMATVAGFASYLTMNVAPMRAFGFQAAVGVFLSAALALVVIPAVLSYARAMPKPPPALKLGPFLSSLAVRCRTHRWVTLGVTLAVMAGAGVTAWKVAADSSMESFFRPGSEPAEADRFLRGHFGGSTFVQVFMSGDMRDPVVLEELRSVAEEARTLEGVTDVNSFLETLEMLSAGFGGVPRLPRTREQVAGLSAFMAGNPGLRQLVDDDLTRAMVQVTLGSQDTRVVGPVVERLREFMQDEVPRRIVAVDVVGAGPRVAAARTRRLEQVSKRVARLLRIHGETPAPSAEKAVQTVLRREFGAWTLEPGRDLDQAVVDRVTTFFNSDDSPFDPFEARETGVALAKLATEPVTTGRLAKALPSTLPAELASDAEGVEMVVPALADRISEARAAVLAERALRDVLSAAGAPRAGDAAATAVRQALQELDDPRVGVPASGSEGTAIEVGVTGSPVINQAFGRSVEHNQISSIVTAFIQILILGVLMFRSFRLGVICFFPAMLTLLINFGIMGWLRVPLDPGTSMVASLAMGVGIDYAIHIIWRRRWRGMTMEETAAKIGPRIVYNAMQVAVCFGVMIVADTLPLSRFGILVTVAMSVAAIATLVLLPPFEKRDGAATA